MYVRLICDRYPTLVENCLVCYNDCYCALDGGFCTERLIRKFLPVCVTANQFVCPAALASVCLSLCLPILSPVSMSVYLVFNAFDSLCACLLFV